MSNLVIDRPLAPAFRIERENLRQERRMRRLVALRSLRRRPQRSIPIGGGAATAWTFTNEGRTKLMDGTFDAIAADSWKMALFQSTSNIGSGSTTYAGLTNEVGNADGYTTGGVAITLALSGTTTVTVAASASPTWTASGGSIVARFAVIYEVSGHVLCYCTLDSTPADVTTTTGNTLTISVTGGVFTLS